MSWESSSSVKPTLTNGDWNSSRTAGDDADAIHSPRHRALASEFGRTLSVEGSSIIAVVVGNDFNDPAVCLPSGEIMPTGPMPLIKLTDFLEGINHIKKKGWVLSGPLNGWPAFSNLALKSLTSKSPLGFVSYVWKDDDDRPFPKASEIPRNAFACFEVPKWTETGWSKQSPGFAFWWATKHFKRPRLIHGEMMVSALKVSAWSSPQHHTRATAEACVVHLFAHRYPVAKGMERWIDQQMYHAGVLVEWSHGLFTTVAELAWLNGCGGYNGKSNWVPDKHAAPPKLFEAMPDEMKRPWDQKRSEIRLFDMEARSKADFEAYLQTYSEKGKLPFAEQRFLQPEVYASAPVMVRGCSPSHLAGFILNYISQKGGYDSLTMNCQHFATDIYAFLAGDLEKVPYSTICRVGYRMDIMAFMHTNTGNSRSQPPQPKRQPQAPQAPQAPKISPETKTTRFSL
jgi:hypothetical protein